MKKSSQEYDKLMQINESIGWNPGMTDYDTLMQIYESAGWKSGQTMIPMTENRENTCGGQFNINRVKGSYKR
ncbi:MAG: hypothetical protein ACP5NW_00890 [Candidatus Woesearchaeota archaeon]